jgi:formylglycine-generating enzyme
MPSRVNEKSQTTIDPGTGSTPAGGGANAPGPRTALTASPRPLVTLIRVSDDTLAFWGDDFMPRGRVMANTWHGRFPWETREGLAGTTPVSRYPPNGFGLHDVTGNVWEWTDTVWLEPGAESPEHVASEPSSRGSDFCCAPQAPRDVLVESDRYVTKGGSHLCAPSYCLRYRPAARQGHSVRSSTSHLGFRCVVRD